jgi:chemotaxis protein methyltransferase CheR
MGLVDKINRFESESELSQKEFELLKDLMYKETGVFLKPSKKALVISRLRNRLIALRLNSFKKYYDILRNPLELDEREYFVNSITTNETYFYRNGNQFNYLKNTVIPKYNKERGGINGNKKIRIWSSASSTGEEAYTIAILLREGLTNINSWKIDIYASDVNSEVLKTAKNGIYSEGRLKRLSPAIIKRYFKKQEKKKPFDKHTYLISDTIRSMVTFYKHNLLVPSKNNSLDIVFLSNVLIYFDLESKRKVIHNISRSLAENGYLFLGQSESLMGINNHEFKFILPSSFLKERKK